MKYNDLTKKQKQYLIKVSKYLQFKSTAKEVFTKRQIEKLIELVACSYMYNEDMKTGDQYEQRLLKNIYFILTGRDDPNEER